MAKVGTFESFTWKVPINLQETTPKNYEVVSFGNGFEQTYKKSTLGQPKSFSFTYTHTPDKCVDMVDFLEKHSVTGEEFWFSVPAGKTYLVRCEDLTVTRLLGYWQVQVNLKETQKNAEKYYNR